MITNKVISYLCAFLAGLATLSILACVYLLRNAKPTINAESYVESINNAIRKIKQSGDGNTTTVEPETLLESKKETQADSLIEFFKNRKIKRSLKN